MDLVVEHYGALDVAKREVVACLRTPGVGWPSPPAAS
jgi:hypothetical protein